MMGKRLSPTNGDEWDVVVARHVYCYLRRPGASARIKRDMRRRERRAGKAETA